MLQGSKKEKLGEIKINNTQKNNKKHTDYAIPDFSLDILFQLCRSI